MSNEILKAFKYRIYPTNEQQTKLRQTFGCTRVVWNKLVENFNAYGKPEFKVRCTEKTLKDSGEFPWLKEVSAAALQQKRIDFDQTKNQFFNKKRKKLLGRMNFKSSKQRQSYRLPNQKFTLDQVNSFIQLEKVGKVSVVMDRMIPKDADYRSVTVSKTPSGKYFVSILVKINVDLLPMTGKKVGIDLGLNDLFILSTGEKINNPRWFRDSQAKLKKAQQHLSRKVKGSNRRNKQRINVARIHEKISNQRSAFLHNMTTSLVRNYDVICIEDLNVSGMAKSNLAKSIYDAGWSTFVSQLDYKCKWYGKTLVKVDRFFPSTQTCSTCGSKDGKKKLDVRNWTCTSCGMVHDRDINSATNILNKGFSDLCGQKIIYTSAESVDYKRREELSLTGDVICQSASSMKRLDKLLCLS